MERCYRWHRFVGIEAAALALVIQCLRGAGAKVFELETMMGGLDGAAILRASLQEY